MVTKPPCIEKFLWLACHVSRKEDFIYTLENFHGWLNYQRFPLNILLHMVLGFCNIATTISLLDTVMKLSVLCTVLRLLNS